jgi:PTH2 family peptidyl-tRNA hydrolase
MEGSIDVASRSQKNTQKPLYLILLITTLIVAVSAVGFQKFKTTENKKGKSKEISPTKNRLKDSSATVDATEEEEGSDYDDDEDEDDYDDEESDEELDTEIKNNYGITDGPFKMVLCVNMSLQMGKGKMCAQCGHATLGAYRSAERHADTAILWWHRMGQAKVAVKVENDEALHELARKAQEAGIVTYLVEDAGRTQIAAGSKTVLAIGPAPVSAFDDITGHLKLL